MIIFGWGRQTVKQYEKQEINYCYHCGNRKNWVFKCYKTWITIFFIPVLPYEIKYVKECPICKGYQLISKEEVMGNESDMHSKSNDDGLTEVQRNFKKKMAELSKKI